MIQTLEKKAYNCLADAEQRIYEFRGADTEANRIVYQSILRLSLISVWKTTGVTALISSPVGMDLSTG